MQVKGSAEHADAARKRILLACDGGTEAHRALEYVAEIVAGRSDFRVSLYHRLPALPPDLREHGGSEYPQREGELDRDLSTRVAAWISSSKEAVQATLGKLEGELVERGVRPDTISRWVDDDASPGESLTDALRRVASQRDCGTIAVSRQHAAMIDGFEKLFSHHTSDALVRKGRGFAIWVIE
jgi:hypothetical protein